MAGFEWRRTATRASGILLAAVLVASAIPAATAEVSEEGRTTVSKQGRTFYVERSASTNLDDILVTVATHTVGCATGPCMPILLNPQLSASASVWEEANGCDGLQREASDCNGDTAVEDPDERVIGIGF